MHAERKPYRPCKRFPRHIPVRATAAEQERIYALARDASLSASRYLVRCAVEGQPPPTEELRAELRTIRFLLEKVSTNVNQIAHKMNLAWLRGERLPDYREIQAVAHGVKRLSEEIRQRLGRR